MKDTGDGALVREYTIGEDSPGGIRIDKYLAEQSGDFTRSQLKQRIACLEINGKAAKLSRKVFPGDRVQVKQIPPPRPDLVPEAIPLDILYEDNTVVVVNKPAGLVVHPGSGNYTGTVVHALAHHYKELLENFGDEELRPGIVHRLDKDTSGVLITAKNVQALEMLASQFRRARVRKEYLALVKGSPPRHEGTVEMALKRDPHHRKRFTFTESGGKPALTRYRVLKFFENYSLVHLRPRTGRTHQLRVHMQYLGCPILGDPVYSRRDSRFPDSRLMLHAWKLKIKLPQDGQARRFTAPLPGVFLSTCRALGWEGDEEQLNGLQTNGE